MSTTDLDLKSEVLAILVKHQGERNAIKGKELARLLGFRSDRTIRQAIEELEKQYPVAATTEPPYGYFIAETEEEKQKYQEVLKSRAIQNWERWHNFNRSAGLKLNEATQVRLI